MSFENGVMGFMLMTVLFLVPLIGCWIGIAIQLPKAWSQYGYEREEYWGNARGTAIATLLYLAMIGVIWLATR